MDIRLSSLRIRWLTMLALLGLLLVVAPMPIDRVAVDSFHRGETLAKSAICQRDWRQKAPQAEEAYQYASARRSRDPQPWRGLGTLYLTWLRPDDALKAYNQARQVGGSSAVSPQYLARLYGQLGDYARSMGYWTEYLVQQPNDPAARLSLAQIAIVRFEWQQAHAQLQHLLSVAPDDPLVNAWLGLLLLEREPSRGQHHLERASADPALTSLLQPVLEAGQAFANSEASDDPAYRSALLGAALLHINDATLLSSATRLSRECATIDPATATLDAELGASPGTLNVFNTNIEQQALSALALRSLLEATYQNPAYAEAYAYLSQALDQIGRPALAWTALDAALQLAPYSPLILTRAGLYWDHHEAPALARHYYQQAYEQEPGNATLSLEIAGTYAAEGQYTAAEAWLLVAAEIAPQDIEVWKTIAHFYLDSGIGVQESGLPAATQLLQMAPNDAVAYDLLGWAHFLAQKNTQAEANLSQALALDPTLASAHYHLGRLRSRQGRFAEAARAYRYAESYDREGQLTVELERAWHELPQAYH